MNKYLFPLFLLCPLLVNAGAKADLKQGNKAYDKEKYGAAYEYYQKAAQAGHEEALYNSAAALYRLQDYPASAQTYLQIAQDEAQKDPKLVQNAYYNAANAQYMNKQTKEALLSERQAILLNNKDEAAIHNMQFMLEEQKKNNKNQQNKEGNKNSSQNNQDNDKQNQQGNNQDKQNQDNKDRQEQEEKDKLSREQAQDILKMLGDNEKKNTPPPLEGSSGKDKNSQSQVEKDW